MDSGIAALIGATIGIVGIAINNHLTAQRELDRWERKQLQNAYINCMKSLTRLLHTKNTDNMTQQEKDALSDARADALCWAAIVRAYQPEGLKKELSTVQKVDTSTAGTLAGTVEKLFRNDPRLRKTFLPE